MKILVTGSAGFLGANFIRYLIFNYKGVEVVGVDQLKDVSYMHNVYMNKSTEFHIANVCDDNIIAKIFDITQPDYVVHFASSNNDCLINNISGIRNIAINCARTRVKKLIYISTTNVYRVDSPDLDMNGDMFSIIPINEYNPREAYNEYILSKITSEDLLPIIPNLSYSIIRTTEVFGPRQHHGTIINMFLDAKGHGKIVLPNKGANVVDLIHIEDFCSAIMLVLNDSKKNEIYNLSGNSDFIELEIAAMVAEVVENTKIEFIDDGEIISPIIDSDKIKGLGWKPAKKFKHRIKDTIYWFNANQWFFK